jgi:ribosomal protein S21
MSFQHSLTLARAVWSHRIDPILLLQVFVRDNNVDQALRVLEKKMQREGVFREIRRRRFYEKPSEKAAGRGAAFAQMCPKAGYPRRTDRRQTQESKDG